MSSANRRDAVVEHALRAGAAAGAGTTAGVCPDAETMAAFEEGGLGAGERASFVQHAASCARCQQVLATIARTAPAAAEAAPGWLAWLRGAGHLRWVVPATVSATALALYVTIRPPAIDRGAARPMASTSDVQPAAGAERPSAEIEAPFAAPVPAATPGPGVQARKTVPQPGDAATGEPHAGVRPPVPAARPAELTAAPAAPPAQVAREEAEARDRAEARGGVVGGVAGGLPDEVDAAPPAAPPLPAARPASRAEGPDAVGAMPAATRAKDRRLTALREPLYVRSPDGASWWRIGSAGHVARSTDRGVEWHAQATGVQDDLLAGSAPSSLVCWVVGAGGMVLLTTDGERWTLVAAPAPADLVGVAATSALAATVTTRDGERFATRDGGRTWTPVMP